MLADTLRDSLRDTVQADRQQSAAERLQEISRLSKQEQDALFEAIVAKQEEGLPSTEGVFFTADMRAQMQEQGALRAQQVQTDLIAQASQRAADLAAAQLQLQMDLTQAQQKAALDAAISQQQQVMLDYVLASAQSADSVAQDQLGKAIKTALINQGAMQQSVLDANTSIGTAQTQTDFYRDDVNSITKTLADDLINRALGYNALIQQQGDLYLQATQLTAAVSALNTELTLTQQQLATLQTTKTSLESQRQTQQAALDSAKTQLDGVTAQLNNLPTIDPDGVRATLTNSQRAINDTIASLQADLTATSSALTAANTAVSNAIAEKNTAIRNKAAALATAVGLSQADISSLGTLLAGAKTRFDAADAVTNGDYKAKMDNITNTQRPAAEAAWTSTKQQHLDRLTDAFNTYVRNTANPATSAKDSAFKAVQDAARDLAKLVDQNSVEQGLLNQLQGILQGGAPIKTGAHILLELQMDTLTTNLNTTYPTAITISQGKETVAKQLMDGYAPTIAPTSAATTNMAITYAPAATAQAAYDTATTALSNLYIGIQGKINQGIQLEQQRLQYLADRALPRAAFKSLFTAQRIFNTQQCAAAKAAKTAAAAAATTALSAARGRSAGLTQNVTFVASKVAATVTPTTGLASLATTIAGIDVATPRAAKVAPATTLATTIRPTAATAVSNLGSARIVKTGLDSSLGTNAGLKTGASTLLGPAITNTGDASTKLNTASRELQGILDGRALDSGTESALTTSTLPLAQGDTATKLGTFNTAIPSRTDILQQRTRDVTTASSALTAATIQRDSAATSATIYTDAAIEADSAHSVAVIATTNGPTVLATKEQDLAAAKTSMDAANLALTNKGAQRDATVLVLPGVNPVAPTKTAAHLQAQSLDPTLSQAVTTATTAMAGPRTSLETMDTTTLPAAQQAVTTAETAVTTTGSSFTAVSGALGTATTTQTTAKSALDTATTSLSVKQTEKSQRQLDDATLVQSKADLSDRLTIKNFAQTAYAMFTSIRTGASIAQDSARASKQIAAIDKDNSVAVKNTTSQGILLSLFPFLASKSSQQVTTSSALDTVTITTIPSATIAKTVATDTLAGLQAPVPPTLVDPSPTAQAIQTQLDTTHTQNKAPTLAAATTAATQATTTGTQLADTSSALGSTLDGRATDTAALAGLDATAASIATQSAATALATAEASRPTFSTAETASANLAAAQQTLDTVGPTIPATLDAVASAKEASDSAAATLSSAISSKDSIATIVNKLRSSLDTQGSGIQLTSASLQDATQAGADAYQIMISIDRPTSPTKTATHTTLESRDTVLSQALTDALRDSNLALAEVQAADGRITLTLQSIAAIESQPVLTNTISAQLDQAYSALWASGNTLDSALISIDTKTAQRDELLIANVQATSDRRTFMQLLPGARAALMTLATSVRDSYKTAQASYRASRLAANQAKVDKQIDASQYRPNMTANTLVTTRDGKIAETQSLMDTAGLDAMISALRESHNTILTSLNRADGTFQLVVQQANNVTVTITGDSALAARIQQEISTNASANAQLSSLKSSQDQSVATLYNQLLGQSSELKTTLAERGKDLTDLDALMRKLNIAAQETETKKTLHEASLAEKAALDLIAQPSVDSALQAALAARQTLDSAIQAYERTQNDLAAIDTSLFQDVPHIGDSTYTTTSSKATDLAVLIDSIHTGLEDTTNLLKNLPTDSREFTQTPPTMPVRDMFLTNEDIRLRNLLALLEQSINTTREQYGKILLDISKGETLTQDLADRAENLRNLLDSLSAALNAARETRDKAKEKLDGAIRARDDATLNRDTFIHINKSLTNLRTILEGYLNTLQLRNEQRAYLIGLRDAYITSMNTSRKTKDESVTTKTTQGERATAQRVELELKTIQYLQDLLASKLRQKDQLIQELARVGDAIEMARALRDKAQLEKLNDVVGRLRDALAKVQEAQRLFDENEARIRALELAISLQEKLNDSNRQELERLRKELAMRYQIRENLRTELENAKRDLEGLRAELNRLLRENLALNDWKKIFTFPGTQISIGPILAVVGAVGAVGLGAAFGLSFLFQSPSSISQEETEDKCAAVRKLAYGTGLAKGKTEGFSAGKADARKEYYRQAAEAEELAGVEDMEEEPEVEPDDEAMAAAEEENAVPEAEEEEEAEVEEPQTGGQDEAEEQSAEAEYTENAEAEAEAEADAEEEPAEDEEFVSPFNPTVAPEAPEAVPPLSRGSIKVAVPSSIDPDCKNDYIESYRDGYLAGRGQTYIRGWESFIPSAGIDFLGERTTTEPEEVEPTEEEDGAVVNGEAEPLDTEGAEAEE